MFKGTIDTEDIEDGDYKLYVITFTDEYIAESTVSNKVLKEQVSTFTDNKTITTRNNYLDNSLIFSND